MTQSLYDRDILLWVEDTVNKLKAGDFHNLDIDNLIEEVESLGISQKRELLSRLIILLEHLLKRLYISMPDNYRGWETTIRNQRIELKLLYKQAPSLKNIWMQEFEVGWNFALKKVKEDYPTVRFPLDWQFAKDLESMLECKFWQDN